MRAGESTESLSVYEEVTFSILATILKYIFHYFKREIMIGGSEDCDCQVQMMRRQIAKLNHRVMAVELENQQAQQREMVNIYFQNFKMLSLNSTEGDRW